MSTMEQKQLDRKLLVNSLEVVLAKYDLTLAFCVAVGPRNTLGQTQVEVIINDGRQNPAALVPVLSSITAQIINSIGLPPLVPSNEGVPSLIIPGRA